MDMFFLGGWVGVGSHQKWMGFFGGFFPDFQA